MDKVPEDPSARLAFLERWAVEQQTRLYADEIARVLSQARRRTGQMGSPGGVTTIPVVITKPSDTPVDRAGVFADLMAGLREYEWADPIVSECDERRYVAPNATDIARSHRPGASWLLYMEDDVILGPDFGLIPELLREADELFPHAGAVNFFSLWLDEPGWSIHSMGAFGSLLCTAIRNTDHLVGFRGFVDRAVTQGEGEEAATPSTRYDFPDLAVQTFLALEFNTYAVWCPSLVQHADVTSAIWGEIKNLPKRISQSYARAYGEAPDASPGVR